MLNYIIATYSANKLEYILQIQLQTLYTLVISGDNKYLSQITIVCPQVDSERPHYYQKDIWEKLFEATNVKLVYLDYVGDNKNASYDQWIQGVLKYPDFEYYLFIEDDYTLHPSLVNFDSLLVDYYNDVIGESKEGYVCSLYEGYLGHISNGIVNKKTIDSLGETVLEDFYKLVQNEFCQIGFIQLFDKKKIDIITMHKDFLALFWCSSKQKLTNFSPKDVTKFAFIPVQYLMNEYFEMGEKTVNNTNKPKKQFYQRAIYR
jgi:hypothetical protein